MNEHINLIITGQNQTRDEFDEVINSIKELTRQNIAAAKTEAQRVRAGIEGQKALAGAVKSRASVVKVQETSLGRLVDTNQKAQLRGIRQIGRESRAVGAGFGVWSSSLGSVSTLLGGSVLFGLERVGRRVATVTAEFERLRLGLAAIEGSSTIADRQIRRIRELADLPGVGFTSGLRQISGLRGAGITFNQAERLIREISNVASLSGATQEDVGEALRQIRQAVSAGAFTQQDLRPILQRIPLLQPAFLRTFGSIQAGEVNQAIEARNETIVQGLDRLLTTLEGGPRAPADTLSNAMERLRDSFDDLARDLGRDLLPAMTTAVNLLNRLFQAFRGPTGRALLFGGGAAIAGGLAGALGSRLLGAGLGGISGATPQQQGNYLYDPFRGLGGSYRGFGRGVLGGTIALSQIGRLPVPGGAATLGALSAGTSAFFASRSTSATENVILGRANAFDYALNSLNASLDVFLTNVLNAPNRLQNIARTLLRGRYGDVVDRIPQIGRFFERNFPFTARAPIGFNVGQGDFDVRTVTETAASVGPVTVQFTRDLESLRTELSGLSDTSRLGIQNLQDYNNAVERLGLITRESRQALLTREQAINAEIQSLTTTSELIGNQIRFRELSSEELDKLTTSEKNRLEELRAEETVVNNLIIALERSTEARRQEANEVSRQLRERAAAAREPLVNEQGQFLRITPSEAFRVNQAPDPRTNLPLPENPAGAGVRQVIDPETGRLLRDTGAVNDPFDATPGFRPGVDFRRIPSLFGDRDGIYRTDTEFDAFRQLHLALNEAADSAQNLTRSLVTFSGTGLGSLGTAGDLSQFGVFGGNVAAREALRGGALDPSRLHDLTTQARALTAEWFRMAEGFRQVVRESNQEGLERTRDDLIDMRGQITRVIAGFQELGGVPQSVAGSLNTAVDQLNNSLAQVNRELNRIQAIRAEINQDIVELRAEDPLSRVLLPDNEFQQLSRQNRPVSATDIYNHPYFRGLRRDAANRQRQRAEAFAQFGEGAAESLYDSIIAPSILDSLGIGQSRQDRAIEDLTRSIEEARREVREDETLNRRQQAEELLEITREFEREKREIERTYEQDRRDAWTNWVRQQLTDFPKLIVQQLNLQLAARATNFALNSLGIGGGIPITGPGIGGGSNAGALAQRFAQLGGGQGAGAAAKSAGIGLGQGLGYAALAVSALEFGRGLYSNVRGGGYTDLAQDIGNIPGEIASFFRGIHFNNPLNDMVAYDLGRQSGIDLARHYDRGIRESQERIIGAASTGETRNPVTGETTQDSDAVGGNQFYIVPANTEFVMKNIVNDKEVKEIKFAMDELISDGRLGSFSSGRG